MAKGKAKIPSTANYQYYLTWNPDPTAESSDGTVWRVESREETAPWTADGPLVGWPDGPMVLAGMPS